MVIIEILAYLSGVFASFLQRLVANKGEVTEYVFLVMDLLAFFSVFDFIYEIYKQDTERSRILLKNPLDLTVYNDVQEKEKKRKYSFYSCITVVTFLWITKSIIDSLFFRR